MSLTTNCPGSLPRHNPCWTRGPTVNFPAGQFLRASGSKPLDQPGSFSISHPLNCLPQPPQTRSQGSGLRPRRGLSSARHSGHLSSDVGASNSHLVNRDLCQLSEVYPGIDALVPDRADLKRPCQCFKDNSSCQKYWQNI